MEEQKQPGSENQPKLFGKYHELALLLVGFGLTTIVGGSLGYYFQQKSWTNESNVRRYEGELSKSSEIFDDISGLLDRRLYATRRLIWAHKEGDVDEVKIQREAYRQAVYEWNGNLNRNLARIERYFGKEMRADLDMLRVAFRIIDDDLGKYRKAPEQNELKRIEDYVDQFNYKVYAFNLNMLTHIQQGKIGIYLDPDLHEKIPSK